MKNILYFLGRFKNIKPPHKFIKEEFISLILEDMKIDLKQNDMNINNNKIQITSNPIIKTEVILNKENILKKLNENLVQYNTEIKDIY